MFIFLSIKTFSEQHIELFAVAFSSWRKHRFSCYRTQGVRIYLMYLCEFQVSEKNGLIITVALTAHQLKHNVMALHVLTKDFLLTTTCCSDSSHMQW